MAGWIAVMLPVLTASIDPLQPRDLVESSNSANKENVDALIYQVSKSRQPGTNGLSELTRANTDYLRTVYSRFYGSSSDSCDLRRWLPCRGKSSACRGEAKAPRSHE
jgi:hypothetical protein